MPSLLDALQTLVPVNLRRVAGDSHSIAKQASFETQFFSSVGRFGGVLGGPKGGKNQLLRHFLSTFFSNVFWHRFFIVFLKVEPLILLIFLHTRGVL